MAIHNTTRRWGAIAQLLHWFIALFIIAQLTLAWLFDDLPAGAKKLTLLARHKSIGISVLMLACLRLGWRWANPTPALPDTLKPYERRLARFTHALLYVLLFAVPLTGWTMSSARGFPVSWFGLFQLPDLVPKDKSLYNLLLTSIRYWRGSWEAWYRCTSAPLSSTISCSRTTYCGACCPLPTQAEGSE